MEKFKFLEHTADIKFQAFGKTLGEVFKNSALAMSNSLFEKKVKEKKSFKINVKGTDLENLLYNFLEEFLFLLDSKNFLLSKIKKLEIDKKNLKLKAEVTGDNIANYDVHLDIKAITYNEMFVKQEENNWVAQVILDV